MIAMRIAGVILTRVYILHGQLPSLFRQNGYRFRTEPEPETRWLTRGLPPYSIDPEPLTSASNVSLATARYSPAITARSGIAPLLRFMHTTNGLLPYQSWNVFFIFQGPSFRASPSNP